MKLRIIYCLEGEDNNSQIVAETSPPSFDKPAVNVGDDLLVDRRCFHGKDHVIVLQTFSV